MGYRPPAWDRLLRLVKVALERRRRKFKPSAAAGMTEAAAAPPESAGSSRYELAVRAVPGHFMIPRARMRPHVSSCDAF